MRQIVAKLQHPTIKIRENTGFGFRIRKANGTTPITGCLAAPFHLTNGVVKRRVQGVVGLSQQRGVG